MFMFKKTYIIVFVLLVGLLTWVSPAKADDSKSVSVTVGVMASLSGNWASIGDMTRKGLTLASEELNSKDGILGHQIQLTFQDTDEAVSAAKVVSTYRFMRSQGVNIFVGPTGGPGGIALAPIAARDDVVMITPSVGVRDFHTAADNLFNTQGVWETSSGMLARHAYGLGIRQIAIFSSEHPFEVRQADAFEAAFREAGGKITTRQEPNPERTDLRSEVLRIVQSKAPAVFLANYNQMGLAAKQLKEAGFRGSQFATQIDSSRLVSAAGALNSTIFARLTDNPVDRFGTSFRERFNEEPSYTADFAYDALMALANAIKIAGAFEPTKIKVAMLGVSFDGASGHIAFDKQGCVIRKPTAWRVVGDKFEYLATLQ
jgi:branched-chain amino acid transport system substrate-binding protein